MRAWRTCGDVGKSGRGAARCEKVVEKDLGIMEGLDEG